MLVLVTGGTGYVGSHAIAALVRAGHSVRVLARTLERVPAALTPLGVDEVETALGDVTDPAAVERALEGCHAVLHAASIFSMDARRADEMRAVNVRGTEIVLGTAHRRGLDPIVFVSSELALLPPADGAVLTPGSPVGQTRWPYCRSKADSEQVARRFQALGAPVVSVMPAAVWGPQDPHFGEGMTLATNVLRNRFPIVMRGGMHIADVRDVAAVLAAVMEPGRAPRGCTWWPGSTSRCRNSSARSPNSADGGSRSSSSALVPGRVRRRGRPRAAAAQHAAALAGRGDLGDELRRPLRRFEDPR